ncbi:hypothetical protein FH972_023056 [Carpinus fangiana]|uniref:Heparan-alpha-glucosaminide N-acetyltransferase catalytic domain-containing protein n=1 Tax=Carpinus fangiana TaxID=176857 RepID=A0A5N6KUC3_9ROSI|nr:hypothetical protein FH972_023056 [Carpinus fangiana]
MAAEAQEESDDRLQETDVVPPEQSDAEANRIAANNAPTTSNPQANSYGSIAGSSIKPAIPSPRALAPDLLRGLLMVFQSIDHSAMAFGAWQHGTGLLSEDDGQVVDTWNSPSAWTARMLTHLCAPGFMFLLGMGVVYFGRSRAKLGWTVRSMVSHFAVRALVLFLVNEFIGLGLGAGQVLVLNIVLVALAVNYFLAGLLWLLINYTEPRLARALSRLTALQVDDDAERPLLNGVANAQTAQQQQKITPRATSLSWHVHNTILLALAAVTIWWNILLSPDSGHCLIGSAHTSSPLRPDGNVTSLGIWFDFWFFPVRSAFVISGFPPLAWTSFAILGLLYGRIVTARPWSRSALNASNAAVGVGYFAIFAATRLLHFGNLSEGCLRMPEQHGGNQYLASFRAFFYITKYPPSVAYLCLTMALNHLLLALFGALPPSFAAKIPTLMTFGTSALFFYVAHLFLFMGSAVVINPAFGHPLGYEDPIRHKPAYGLGNTWRYWLTWVVGLAILLPLCWWYGRFKAGKGPNSIWRFF